MGRDRLVFADQLLERVKKLAVLSHYLDGAKNDNGQAAGQTTTKRPEREREREGGEGRGGVEERGARILYADWTWVDVDGFGLVHGWDDLIA
jgi:hypothetical protein